MFEPAGEFSKSAPARALMICAVAAALMAHSALGRADQLELDALVQEGALILEEAEALAPVDQTLTQEEREIASSEKTLREEVQALNRDITQFNAVMAEQEHGAEELQAQCAGRTEDKELVDSCNARIARMRDEATKLGEQRSELRAREEEMNARVDKYNAWGRDYAKRKQEQDSRDELNRSDSEDWLGRAKKLLASKEFTAWLARAGNPAACGGEQVGDLASLPLRSALARAQACLKAVKAAGR
ncbi:MAG TPA: hypothetical protein VMH26_08605 [Burkholderiales bacterium]|nr:hypothetical protein [Burkholderiales bacterium]